MALLFDLDTERHRRANDAFEIVADHIRGLDPRDAIATVQRYQNRLSGLHAEATAKLTAETGSDRAAKRAMNDGKTSKRQMAKAAKRGEAASRNPDLAKKVEAGELSEEQLNVIAEAFEQTGGAAAQDDEFINKIAAVNPDQGESIKDDYIAAQTTKQQVQSNTTANAPCGEPPPTGPRNTA